MGTTGTTAVDPVRAVGELAHQAGMWHHVDAAYAGNAMLCPEFRHHQDGLDLVAPVPFALVCFRHRAGNRATESLGEAVNRSGHSFLTPSRVAETSFLRVSIGQMNTREEHVERLWRLVGKEAAPLL